MSGKLLPYYLVGFCHHTVRAAFEPHLKGKCTWMVAGMQEFYQQGFEIEE